MTDYRIRLLTHPGTITGMLLISIWVVLGALIGDTGMSTFLAWVLGGFFWSATETGAKHFIPSLSEVVDDGQ